MPEVSICPQEGCNKHRLRTLIDACGRVLINIIILRYFLFFFFVVEGWWWQSGVTHRLTDRQILRDIACAGLCAFQGFSEATLGAVLNPEGRMQMITRMPKWPRLCSAEAPQRCASTDLIRRRWMYNTRGGEKEGERSVFIAPANTADHKEYISACFNFMNVSSYKPHVLEIQREASYDSLQKKKKGSILSERKTLPTNIQTHFIVWRWQWEHRSQRGNRARVPNAVALPGIITAAEVIYSCMHRVICFTPSQKRAGRTLQLNYHSVQQAPWEPVKQSGREGCTGGLGQKRSSKLYARETLHVCDASC